MKWTIEEIEISKKMLTYGYTYKDIANTLNRTEYSIRMKLYKLGFKSIQPYKNTKQDILCPTCNTYFKSYINDERKFCSSSCSTTYNNLLKSNNINNIIIPSDYELDEYKKCNDDIIYFGEVYCKITLRPYQKDILLKLKESGNLLLLSPRQSGSSTLLSIYLLWYCIYKSSMNSYILIHDNMLCNVVHLIELIKIYCNKLPSFFNFNIYKSTNSFLQFNKNSTVISSYIPNTYKNDIDILMIDNFSNMNTLYLDKLYKRLDDNKININRYIYSSCKSNKLLNDLYNDDNTFDSLIISISDIDFMNNDKFKNDMIRMIGKDSFENEYNSSYFN